MKRIILLLVIGVVAMALAFSCSGDPKKETEPDKGDTIEQETLKVGEDDSTAGQPVSEKAKAIEQETLTRGQEDPEDQTR